MKYGGWLTPNKCAQLKGKAQNKGNAHFYGGTSHQRDVLKWLEKHKTEIILLGPMVLKISWVDSK